MDKRIFFNTCEAAAGFAAVYGADYASALRSLERCGQCEIHGYILVVSG